MRKVLLFIAVLCFVGLSAGLFAATAEDKSSTIDITAADTAAAGFVYGENLISTTNTLNMGYSNSFDLDGFINNNLCEKTNDSVFLFPDAISNAELSELWVTWDTNFLYVAIQGQVEGSVNNIMCFLDTNAEQGIIWQDNLLYMYAWDRDICFADGFRPNVYVGMWCANSSANFNGTDASGNAQLHHYDANAGIWTMLPNGPGNEGVFSAWYNGSTQASPEKRLFMFKINWSVLTNPQTVSSVTSLTLRIAAVSTGPYDGSPVFDVIPESEFALSYERTTYVNNYFSIPVTDASGNILIGVNPRDTSGVNFYPGSRRQPIITKPALLAPADGASNVDPATEFSIGASTHTNGQDLIYKLYLSTNSNFIDTTPVLLSASRSAGVMIAGVGGIFFLMIGLLLPLGKGKRRILSCLILFCFFSGIMIFSSCSDDDSGLTVITYSGDPLLSGTTYYWKVSATDPEGYIRMSDVSSFTTK